MKCISIKKIKYCPTSILAHELLIVFVRRILTTLSGSKIYVYELMQLNRLLLLPRSIGPSVAIRIHQWSSTNDVRLNGNETNRIF